jgi:hypothetical protein
MSKVVPDPAAVNTYQFWSERWPNACDKCGGWGLIEYPCTREEPGGADLCSCIEDGICPRCGAEDAFPFDDVQVCQHCEWDLTDPDGDDADYSDYGPEDL